MDSKPLFDFPLNFIFKILNPIFKHQNSHPGFLIVIKGTYGIRIKTLSKTSWSFVLIYDNGYNINLFIPVLITNKNNRDTFFI